MSRSGLSLLLSLGLLAALPAYADQPVPPSSALLTIIEAQWPGWQGGYPGYGQGWEGQREHCWQMRERLRFVRYRMYSAPPWERERLESRIYELRTRLWNECWGQWREDE